MCKPQTIWHVALCLSPLIWRGEYCICSTYVHMWMLHVHQHNKCVFMFAFLSTQECICWLLACKCMSQRLYRADSVPEPAPTSCVSSSQSQNKDEVYLHMHQRLCIECASLSRGKFFMFAIISKCSFRNDSCISNWQCGSTAAASLTIHATYNVVSADRESELDTAQAFKKTMQRW